MGSGKSSEELLDLRAVVIWTGMNLVSFSHYSPKTFFLFPHFFALSWVYAAGLHFFMFKTIHNLHKGNFLCREFWAFYVFCMYFIVMNWTTKTPPCAVSPHFAHWLGELAQTPGMSSLGSVVGISARRAGVHIWWSKGSSPGLGLPEGQRGEVWVSLGGVPSCPYPFSSALDPQCGYPDSCPHILDLF